MHFREVDDDVFLAKLTRKIIELVALADDALRGGDDGLWRDALAADIAHAPRVDLVLDPFVEVSRVDASEDVATLLESLT